jgi:hypothetical protein
MDTLARRAIGPSSRRAVRIGAIVVGVVLLASLIGFTRHVGIKVHYGGGQRGVEDFPTQIGWVFYLRGFSTVLDGRSSHRR